MTKLLYSNRFASDLAGVTSANIERKIFDILDTIEAAGDIGSKAGPNRFAPSSAQAYASSR